MEELVWHFPTEPAEAVTLLQQTGASVHAGGTGLLRTGVARYTSLIDLHRLPLRRFEARDGMVELGAMLTFADVVKKMDEVQPDSILVKSLGRAAATPLRNRITIGGSVAMAPPWSSLIGPLLALEAEVVLLGAGGETVSIDRFLEDRALRKGKLVTAVRFKPGEWRPSYHSAAVTRFDYAAFTISALVRLNGGQEIEDARLAVTGSKGRYQRLAKLEETLIGRKAGDLGNLSQLLAGANVEFARKSVGSAEYVRHLFQVELERTLLQAIEG